LRWPWRRFEGIYAAMVKREARQAIETQKMHMIASLYANSAFDESEEGLKARKERIDALEESYDKAITLVYDPTAYDHEKGDIDWDNPFWKAAQRAKQQREALVANVHGDATVQEAVEMDQDQLEARMKSRQGYDQL
jgi:hypothetical protein